MSCIARKPVFKCPTGSDTNQAVQPQQMVKRLEISDLGSRGIVLLVSMKQKTDQLICTFVFPYSKSRFSHEATHMTIRTYEMAQKLSTDSACFFSSGQRISCLTEACH